MSYIASAIRSMQYGSIDLTGVTSNPATITSVNTASAVVVFLGATGGSVDTNTATHSCRVALTNATTVTAFINTSPGATMTVKFVVIEFHPRLVKSIQAVNRGGSGAITITSVDTTKTVVFLLGLTSTDTSANIQAILASATLTNATTVTIACGANASVYVMVVEFK